MLSLLTCADDTCQQADSSVKALQSAAVALIAQAAGKHLDYLHLLQTWNIYRWLFKYQISRKLSTNHPL